MIEQVKQYFADNEWRYYHHNVDLENPTFLFSLETESTTYDCTLHIYNQEERFAFYVTFPAKVPKEKRGIMIKAVNAINCGLFFKKF